jgi:dsRNA-specific ribonuclease
VIALCVGSQLYHDKPHIIQGTLSILKAVIVDNENLARVCLEIGPYKYLYHQIPDLGQRIAQFQRDVRWFKIHSSGKIDTLKVLADLVEAIVGVVWVDSGRNISATAAVVDRLLGRLIVDSARFGE